MTGAHLWEADTRRPTGACGEGGSWERMGRLSHVVGVLSLVLPPHRCGGAPSEGASLCNCPPVLCADRAAREGSPKQRPSLDPGPPPAPLALFPLGKQLLYLGRLPLCKQPRVPWGLLLAHMPSAPCPRVRSFTLRGGPGGQGRGIRAKQTDPGCSSDKQGTTLGPETG